MAKNFKGKAQRPPLSVLDKVLYCLLIVFFPVCSFYILFFFADTLPKALAYRNPYVVACWNSGVLWPFPLFAFLMLLMALPASLMEKRQPIFGNKNYKAPVFSHTIKVHPFCSREFWLELSDNSRQCIQKTRNWLLLGLVACLLLACLGLFPRHVLTSQRTVIRYNALNYPVESYSIYDTQKLIIAADYSSYKGSEDWNFSMELIFDTSKDVSYAFRPSYFDRMSREEALRHMLYLKSHFTADKYEIGRTDLVDDVIRDQAYTDAEAELLYQLFDITP